MAGSPPSARRANEILTLASQLFSERGYRAVSMRTLAQAAGIQGGSLYHHFPSKEDMLWRIVQFGSEGFFAQLSPLLAGSEPYALRLHRFARDFVLRSWERRHPIIVLFREADNLEPDHATQLRLVRRRFQQGFQRFLADGVAAGELNLGDPKLAGIAILDMLTGVDNWMRTSGHLSITDVADTYATLVSQLAGTAPGLIGGHPRTPGLERHTSERAAK